MRESEYREAIHKKADAVKNKKDLIKLIDEIIEHDHDYGTIVHGCMAAMKAAFNVVNDSPKGGITGFQAGCLGWECVREFMYIKGPARLVDYEDLLFPQYASKFEKVISPETWDYLREMAKKHLEETDAAHPKVVAHWKQIASGNPPFGFQIGEP